MSVSAIKNRLTERDQIQKAVGILVADGLSRQGIYSKIVSLCHVDLDVLNDVLYSPGAHS